MSPRSNSVPEMDRSGEADPGLLVNRCELRTPDRSSDTAEWDADVAIARRHLERLVGPHDRAWFAIRMGEPVPWARAGSFKGRRFTPVKLKNAERDLAMGIRSGLLTDAPLLSNVAIVGVFFISNRRRVDVDNLMKTVLDAGTQAGAWRDDCQVTAQAAFAELDRARPRTLIALCETRSSLDRTVPASRVRGALLAEA